MELTLDAAPNSGPRGGQPVAHVVVVGFHAKLGAVVEFAYPRLRGSVQLRSPRFAEDTADVAAPHPDTHAEHEWGSLPNEWRLLPQMALPDGIHEQKADVVFFTLPHNVHCVAMFRQSAASDAVAHSADSRSKEGVAARGSVQKSVVVLGRRPLFGAIAERLDVAVRAYFNQGDFSKTGVLVSLYHSLNLSLTRESLATPSTLFHGLSLRRLVRLLGPQLLRLLKLILLERRIVIAAKPVRVACNAVVSLASVFPGALDSLSPDIDPIERIQPAEKNLGYPLHLFAPNSNILLQPYAPLTLINQILAVKRRGCLVGTSRNVATLMAATLANGSSNASATHAAPDALLDLTPTAVTSPSLVFPPNSSLSQTVQLSNEELAFARDLIAAAKTGIRTPDGSGALAFASSDDYIRARLRQYITGFIRSTVGCKNLRPSLKAAATNYSASGPKPIFDIADRLRNTDLSVLSPYHQPFVRTWLWSARNCKVWVGHVSPTVGLVKGPPEPEMSDTGSNLNALIEAAPGLENARRAASQRVEKWTAELSSSRPYTEMATASQQVFQGMQGWLRSLETGANRRDTPLDEVASSVDITSMTEKHPSH